MVFFLGVPLAIGIFSFWLSFGAPFRYERILTNLDKLTKQRFNVFIKDNKAPNGDGCIFIFFESPPTEIRKIIKNYQSKSHGVPWETGPMRKGAVNLVIKLMIQFQAPVRAIPPFLDSSIRWRTRPKENSPNEYFANLCIADEKKGRFWIVKCSN